MQLCLSSDDCDQWVNALIATFKPLILSRNREALQLVELAVGEDLEEFVALLFIAARVIDVKRVEAAAVQDSQTDKLEQHGLVSI